jgi:FMN phosphatase YigB (HAD superfamily)
VGTVVRGPIEAITFDYWNTIVVSDSGRIQQVREQRWSAMLTGARVRFTSESMRSAFAQVWDEHQAAHDRDEQYQGERAALRSLELMGIGPVDESLVHALVHAFVSAGDVLDLQPAPGVLDVLRTLKSAGLKLGIVCDVGFTPSTYLRDLLARWQVLELFDHWSFSDDVGHFKPSAAIFEHALGGLGVNAARTAHIGDLRPTDVAGALAMGMTALRYRGVHDDTRGEHPEAHHVIDHHDHLPEVLGV